MSFIIAHQLTDTFFGLLQAGGHRNEMHPLLHSGNRQQVADFADKSISHSDDIRLVHPGERGRCILCAIPACFPLLPEEKRISSSMQSFRLRASDEINQDLR